MDKNLELLPLNIDNINGLLNSKIGMLEDIVDKTILTELGLKQAIVYNYDALLCGEIENLELNVENIMEARFFNDNVEINIRNDEGLKGHIAIEKSNELILEDKYEIYHNDYDKVMVKKYLDLDEDGQAYVKYLKPCRLCRKGQK